ncbi:protein of unknown function [Burkholderia multivorans]
MLDTVGFNVRDVNAELPTTVDVNGKRNRSIGRLRSPSGRRAVTFHHIKAHNELRVEGSAALLFLDHNIVASNDLRMTVISLLKAIKDTRDVHIPLRQAYHIFLGQGVAMTRVDTPAMLRLPSGITPAAVVNGIALAGLRCGLHNIRQPSAPTWIQWVMGCSGLGDVQVHAMFLRHDVHEVSADYQISRFSHS